MKVKLKKKWENISDNWKTIKELENINKREKRQEKEVDEYKRSGRI